MIEGLFFLVQDQSYTGFYKEGFQYYVFSASVSLARIQNLKIIFWLFFVFKNYEQQEWEETTERGNICLPDYARTLAYVVEGMFYPLGDLSLF